MKKLFERFLMLLFVLGMSTNVAWADDDPMQDFYWARLIAKPSTSTGGTGKVCVTSDLKPFVFEDPAWKSDTSRADGYSEVYIEISAGTMFSVDLHAHALPDEGSYFTGWSFSNGGTDLGIGTYEWEKYELRQFFLPSKKYGYSNLREYEIYATFMPLLIEGYTISGQNTTVSRTCTQTVTFRVAGTLANVKDFNVPEIIKQTGSGTWTVVPNTTEAWEYENGAGTKNYTYSTTYDDYAEIRVPVTFTADDDNAGEFSATLQLRSKAGKTMNVVLSARTVVASDKEISLYDGKTCKSAIDFSDLAEYDFSEYANPIVKLNGNYSSAVSINKNLTLDLNGYTLSNTLTLSGSKVTIAYSPYGGSANALNVIGGKAILNGGTFGSMTIADGATVEQNGATITGTATNNGALTTTDGTFQGGLSSSNVLVVNGGTFNGATAIDVTAGSADIKKGTITGTTYGIQSKGTITIGKLPVISGGTIALNRISGTLTVNGGRFTDPNNLATGDIIFYAAYFQTNSTESLTVRGKQVWRNTAGPEAREGYAFFVGDQEAAQASNVSVCRIGKTAYASLEDALAYANNNPEKNEVLIFMENDYTLKAGYYTIPANATLVVPMSDEQDATYSIVPRESGDTPSPYAFRTLTLENGVNMTVLGTIELTCTQYCKSGNEAQSIPGGPYGHMILKPGSHITLSSGSELRAWGYITGDGTRDAEGNYLSGEIDARRGSVVREQFQMGDWKGGDISFTMIMDQAPQNMTRLFPVYEYFIQNIESPVKYHPGASLICAVSVDVSYINAYANEIRLIGVETSDPAKWSMFMMDETADAENTWVRKYYDAKKDQQVYEVNNSAQLGSLKIDLGEVSGEFFGLPGKYHIELDSRKFVLPLTSNFKIHLLSGLMEFTQSTSCLPGMEVEVDKEAEIQIIPSTDPSTVSGALYLYDADQWSFMNMKLGSYVGLAGNPKYGAIVTYSATLNGQPTVRNVDTPEAIGDAKLIVHGTFRSASGCSVYTTWTKDSGNSLEHNPFVINPNGTGGASIISTNEDAGTFIFDDASPNFDGVRWDDPANFGQIEHLTGFGNSVLVNFDNNNYGDATYPIQIYTVIEKEMKHSGKNTRMYGFELCTPAKLQNGDGTLVETEGSPAGTSYCYMNGFWTTMKVAEENECFMKDNYDAFYAKPSEYVAVVATVDGEGNVVGNEDHTYSDAAGAGRLFILTSDEMGNCDEWWEVEKKDNLYHCIHPNNDTYYYWDEAEDKWMEQRFTITWKNYDGTEIKSYTIDPSSGDQQEVEYSVTYGTQAEYLGSNPTRPADIDYTYNFTGWTPALGKVTSNVTYTATYEPQPRKYTIIFENEGGDEIERHLLTHNEYPVCENTPTRTGFTLEWEPAVAAVVGDATYRATWLPEPPTKYQITFVDYDGDVENHLLWQGNVTVGTIPTPPANPTGKPETDEYTYVFDHWSPALEAVSATSVKTYTAIYREVAKTYMITFKNGDEVLYSNEYHYGDMPVCPESVIPADESDEQYTYTYAWTPQIQTVVGEETYQWTSTRTTNKYTVTLKSNPSGACTLSGAGMYDYSTSATAVTVSLVANDGYTFTGWSDGQGGTNTTRQMAITGDINLVANFTVPDPDYTITWKSEDGSATLAEVGQKSGTATTFTGATPTKEATAAKSYTFYGWSTQVGTEENEWNYGTIYKNGLTPNATADDTYYAYFKESDCTYDIVWKNEAGTVNLELDYNQPYGAAIAFNSATPTKTATAEYTYTFDGWSTTIGGNAEALPATVTGEATFYAHFISTPIVSGYNLEIGVNGKETLAVATAKDNLILTSNGVSSGQLIGAENLSLNGEAIFRVEKTFNAGEWYAVAVPWTVDPTTGIYAGSSPLSLGSQFYVIEFDAAAYAGGSTNTYDYWHFLHQTGADMLPGKLYMIYLASAQASLDFHKKDGAGISTTQTAVAITGGEGDRANWNAIANPALYHATLSTGATNVQKYNGNDSYIVGSTSNMIVGEPMFVQVSSASTVVATPVGGASPAPYRRAPKAESDSRFVVEIAQNNKLADRLIVETTDEKENRYVIGQDLAKFGVSSKVAQMWINRYDAKLCVNTMETAGVTDYPMSIFAPKAGEYQISNVHSQMSNEAYTLYLTYNGEAIWNLSDAAYTLNLNKGTDANYGLRISARAPQVVTGVDEAIVDAQGDTQKVLINNQVFIIRGEKVYTIDGRLVK